MKYSIYLFLICRVYSESDGRKINVEIIQNEKGKREKRKRKKDLSVNVERDNNASRHKQYLYPEEKLRLTFDITRSFFLLYANINFLMPLAKMKSICCDPFYDFQRELRSFRPNVRDL